MQYPMVMTIRHSRQKLIQKAFQNGQIQSCVAYIQILFQILVEELKDKCQFAFRMDYVIETYYVGVLEFFQSVF